MDQNFSLVGTLEKKCRGRRSRSGVVLSKILGEEELLRLLDVLGWILEEGLLRGFSAEAIDLAVRRGPIGGALPTPPAISSQAGHEPP